MKAGHRYACTTGGRTGTTYRYETNEAHFSHDRQKLSGEQQLSVFFKVKALSILERCARGLENDKDVLKEQWKDKTVWDLIDEYDL